MIYRSLTAGLLLAVSGSNAPSQDAPATHRRVVLLSIDAGSQSTLDAMLAAGALRGGGFETMHARGYSAASMTPASIASTPVSHATIYTGTWPDQHGITGVALPSARLDSAPTSGFGHLTDVDRLWTIVAAARRRVVCIATPGADATEPANSCSDNAPFAALSPRAGTPRLHSAFLDSLERDVGPSPGEPDATDVTRGAMTEDAYVAAALRFAEYESRVVRRELARDDWDLLIVYMPLLDNVQHGYLLTEPAQIEYDAEGGARRARFAGAVARAYAHMDAIVASWITASPLTDFVVVSDHGMLPAHSTVLLNRVLDEAGLRTRYPHPQVRAFSSGGSAQIYVNAQSKFRDGVVRDEDIPAVVARVVDVCRAVRDPATGKPVFTTVASGADLVALHLDNRNAGDVYVSADAGWSISDRVDSLLPTFAPNTLNPATRARLARTPAEAAFLADGRYNEISLGVHGHRPGDPRLQAVFMAVGPHVPHLAGGVRDMVDVAPTVLELLGIPRPAHMAGHAPFLGLSP